jgi:hypothetical protein
MPEEKRRAGALEWVPADAIVVYPKHVVQELLGHHNPSSTRKEMSRFDIPAVVGYEAAQVDWMLTQRNPKLTGYPRTPKPDPKTKGNFRKNAS